MILLIDNYDSFAHNLARYFRRLGQETLVVRNDQLDTGPIRDLAPEAIVLSPGPCTPEVAGNSLEVVRQLWTEFPLLGICLGHQTIAAAFGARIVRARDPVHGRTSPITHDGQGVFSGLPNPLTVCRYHSLVVDEATLPSELAVTARLEDGTIMGIRHQQLPVVGCQFHPESILTQCGYALLAGFLRQAGLAANTDLPLHDELAAPPPAAILPATPVTF